MVGIASIALQPRDTYTQMGVELEPRRPRDQVSDLYISLGATLEDHEEVSVSLVVTLGILNAPCIDGKRERHHHEGWSSARRTPAHS